MPVSSRHRQSPQQGPCQHLHARTSLHFRTGSAALYGARQLLRSLAHPAVLLLLLLIWPLAPKAQVVVYEDFVPKKQFLYTRERMFSAYIHSAGLSVSFEQGRLNRKFRYRGWCVDFSTQLNPKAIRVNWLQSGRRYIYGQINSFCMLRGGYGGRYTFNEKPYWGGVELSMIYKGGFSLGLAFPQYLRIVYGNQDQGYETKIEKFDPDNPYHLQVDRIAGRAPIGYSIPHLRPYPGAYVQMGLNAEFGKKETRTHAIEAGFTYDCYFMPIPLMAENKRPFGFFNLYVGYRFGRRFEKK